MKCGHWWDRRYVAVVLLSLAIWAGALVSSASSEEDQTLRNVALVVIPREILLFSAQAGQWTAVRLDAGERLLQRGADGNVAVVVTSQRAIGFSAALNVAQEIRLPEDETLEAFKVEGNMANFVTRRRAYGFSAFTGRWAVIDRFQLGK
ncbi:MAG: hypothetical protein A2Z31_00425 [candidate division NC10 bacterium RBG_16_65_8]|nr:MAG: hypothetical protein A2Z31_00425 [candidate division NC10 bacterium RBG_16_65_8]